MVLIVQIIKRPKDQVDADNAKRLLLQDLLFIPHPDVQENDTRRRIWFGLESNADPAMGFVGPFKALGCDDIGEHEKSSSIATDCVQAFNQQIVLVFEHESQAFPEHIPASLSVNGIVNSVEVDHFAIVPAAPPAWT